MQAMTTDDENATTAKKRSERTCAGCGKHAPADDLVRVVHDPGSGAIAVDIASSSFGGRGGHVHPSPDCVAKAVKSGFARVFKAKVVCDAAEIGVEIVRAADRRIEGLLTGARRAGQLAVGSDVVVEALRDERAKLVIVARDAAAATKLQEVQKAIAAGIAIAMSEKQRLGSLMNRDEVAVIAILHSGVAAAVAQTYRVSGPFRGAVGGGAEPDSTDARSEAWSSSSEVR
jgi:predicted RNA-binding protein YlxR (DUF448 family)/ribosomal protein L30E